MNELIEQLVSLQEMDLVIDKIDKEIKEEQDQLDSRISAVASREQRISEQQGEIEELEKERRTLEDEMSDRIAHVKERQSKMMQVQTSREQTALLKEIEDAKKSVKENEEKIVAIMEQVEKLTGETSEEKTVLKTEKALVDEQKEKVKAVIEELNKGKKTKIGKRDKQAQDVNGTMIRKYELLRERRNGLAIVNVQDGVCQGCFMNLPPQKYNMLLRGDQVLECPSCQRLIYHQPL
ncbi:MAG: C4-type zinc ribbon domain-containing protein [Desulfofustis sp.]|nr:C4-type zinc ribbon domain-containing protein [Desulfofustis sp.]